MKITDQTVIVAADGGGTGCRVAAGTLGGGILAQASGGPANPKVQLEQNNYHDDYDYYYYDLPPPPPLPPPPLQLLSTITRG